MTSSPEFTGLSHEIVANDDAVVHPMRFSSRPRDPRQPDHDLKLEDQRSGDRRSVTARAAFRLRRVLNSMLQDVASENRR